MHWAAAHAATFVWFPVFPEPLRFVAVFSAAASLFLCREAVAQGVVLKNLDPAGTYHLLALLGDDTNWTEVTEYESDEEGNAALYYRQVGSR